MVLHVNGESGQFEGYYFYHYCDTLNFRYIVSIFTEYIVRDRDGIDFFKLKVVVVL